VPAPRSPRSLDGVVSRLRSVPAGGTAFLPVRRDGQRLFQAMEKKG
jgi:hypothetical protein